MLILTRRDGERIKLTGPNGLVGWITVAEIIGSVKVRLGFEFPASVNIAREELLTEDQRNEPVSRS